MGMWANTYSMKWAYNQINIIRNEPFVKYTFYGMRIWANKHSTKCVCEQKYILRNAPTSKNTFYEIRLPISIIRNKLTS